MFTNRFEKVLCYIKGYIEFCFSMLNKECINYTGKHKM